MRGQGFRYSFFSVKTWITSKGSKIKQVLTGRSNVFLVSISNYNILIDTSTERNRIQLWKNLKKLSIEKLDLLILTHTHYDHAANTRVIKECFGPLVMVHSAEEYFLVNGISRFPEGTNAFTRFIIHHIGHKIADKYNFDSCKPDIIFDHTPKHLLNGDINAYVLPTPGHSDGSVSLVVDHEIAIVGDAMFGVFRNSIFPPFADKPKVLIDSWGKLLNTNCNIFLPAHGFEISRGKLERNYNKWKD
jgi:hydroxyacylglutathione hydrolase